MQGHDLSNIFLPKKGIRKRVSSFDRTGGNDDRIYIQSGERRTIFDVHSSGMIEHIWFTQMNLGDTIEENAFRKVYIEIFWDDNEYPSVQVPLGDFFGMGHGICHNFVSEPLQMSPQDGRALNCWWPMPFKKAAKIDVINECDTVLMLYYYVDYEEKEHENEFLYFHALWHREKRTEGIDRSKFDSWEDYQLKGLNLDGKGNYVMLEVEGEGHYVGCNLNIHNQDTTEEFDWPGEGDDMIYIDGETFPSIYGTGTEDYFCTSWCPSQEYNAPHHGIILPGEANWKGKITYYRYHIKDPITFRKSIKVTIEHGHNNHRSHDFSSTAYWYMKQIHGIKEKILPVEERIPLK